VPRALITHAHGDHARSENLAYLAVADGLPLLRARLGSEATIDTLRYGEVRRIGSVDVSFHPRDTCSAARKSGSRTRKRHLSYQGDYKLARDPTCTPFEPVRCDTFFTESTFGLPIFRLGRQRDDAARDRHMVRAQSCDNKASVLFAYALGKAQRILCGSDRACGALPGPVFCHGASSESMLLIVRRALRCLRRSPSPTRRTIRAGAKR